MKDKIVQIVKDVLEEGNITESTTVDNCCNWTSLKMLQIVMALDEAGVTIPFENMSRISSVNDIINFARK